MSGIIGTAGQNSGIINSFNRGLLPAFKQAWGTNNGVLGVLNSSNFTAVTNRDCFNIGGHWDVSTGKFTVPIAGIYCFGMSAMRQASNGSQIDMRVYKNATSGSAGTYGRLYDNYDNSYQGSGTGTMITSAVVGDWFVFRSDSSSFSCYADDSYTFGFLVS